MTRFTLIFSAIIMLFAAAVPALAQNTGGVFPPVVNDGHKSLQYRAAIDPDNAAGGTNFAQRLHYQQSINGDLMWRLVGQTKKTADSDFDLDFLQAELFWQLSEDGNPYQTGLRFDARLRDEDRSEQLGLNWMNQWQLDDGWRVRAVALSAIQIGDNSADGVFLQTRGQIHKALDGGTGVGVELYNNFGNSKNLGSFKTQGHTFGPYVTKGLTDDISVFAGALFGLSNAAPDTELRVWLTKNL